MNYDDSSTEAQYRTEYAKLVSLEKQFGDTEAIYEDTQEIRDYFGGYLYYEYENHVADLGSRLDPNIRDEIEYAILNEFYLRRES